MGGRGGEGTEEREVREWKGGKGKEGEETIPPPFLSRFMPCSSLNINEFLRHTIYYRAKMRVI